MASRNFPTRNLKWKLSMWEAVEESLLTGNVARVQTAPGVFTEFDPKTMHPDVILERLREAIMNDDNYDAEDPAQLAIASGGRPGSTRVSFNCE